MKLSDEDKVYYKKEAKRITNKWIKNSGMDKKTWHFLYGLFEKERDNYRKMFIEHPLLNCKPTVEILSSREYQEALLSRRKHLDTLTGMRKILGMMGSD